MKNQLEARKGYVVVYLIVMVADLPVSVSSVDTVITSEAVGKLIFISDWLELFEAEMLISDPVASLTMVPEFLVRHDIVYTSSVCSKGDPNNSKKN